MRQVDDHFSSEEGVEPEPDMSYVHISNSRILKTTSYYFYHVYFEYIHRYTHIKTITIIAFNTMPLCGTKGRILVVNCDEGLKRIYGNGPRMIFWLFCFSMKRKFMFDRLQRTLYFFFCNAPVERRLLRKNWNDVKISGRVVWKFVFLLAAEIHRKFPCDFSSVSLLQVIIISFDGIFYVTIWTNMKNNGFNSYDGFSRRGKSQRERGALTRCSVM